MFRMQIVPSIDVSTHSRLKAAGRERPLFTNGIPVSTHSRLKAAGCNTFNQ